MLRGIKRHFQESKERNQQQREAQAQQESNCYASPMPGTGDGVKQSGVGYRIADGCAQLPQRTMRTSSTGFFPGI